MPEATAKNLSDFQVTKFTYMFNAFFDLEQVIKFVNYFMKKGFILTILDYIMSQISLHFCKTNAVVEWIDRAR